VSTEVSGTPHFMAKTDLLDLFLDNLDDKAFITETVEEDAAGSHKRLIP
jgi:hypothetical protein